MAVTSIWRVKGWLGKVVVYVENPDKKENLKIVGILYVIGVLAGIVINWL